MGCNYVQLDSLRYTAWMDPDRHQAMINSGVKDTAAELATSSWRRRRLDRGGARA